MQTSCSRKHRPSPIETNALVLGLITAQLVMALSMLPPSAGADDEPANFLSTGSSSTGRVEQLKPSPVRTQTLTDRVHLAQVTEELRGSRDSSQVPLPPDEMGVFGEDQSAFRSRLELLPGLPSGLGDPDDNPAVRQEYDRYLERTIDPELTLDVILGQPRILVFREIPTRIYIAEEDIATYQVISDTEIAVVGTSPGRTVLTLWVADLDKPGQERVLSYLVRVVEDSGYKERLEAIYAALENEINQSFPDSDVLLSLIGDQLVVRGQAKDVVEATQIIRIVEEHAPPSRRQDLRRGPESVTINQTALATNEFGLPVDALDLTYDRIADAELEGESNVINMLQIPGEQQVMLRVTVAEVNRSALRAIGTNLTIGGDDVNFATAFPAASLLEGANLGLMVAEGGTLSVMRGDLRLTLNALRQLNLAKTLAEPNLVTLHGRSARFQAGGQFPVPAGVVGFGSAAQGVEFVPFGVQLRFVPYITDRDRIRLTVAANVSTRDEGQSAEVSGTAVPGLNTRNFQNTVELREGQTLAVAGLIQTNHGATASRVPFAGDLPVIGRLFSSDTVSADEQELIILITPELVHPVDQEVCLPLPGDDVQEPGDAEFYLKGYLESRRTHDFRSPVRTDIDRQMRYHFCEDIYISGPHGYAYGCPEMCPPMAQPLDPGLENLRPQELFNPHPDALPADTSDLLGGTP